MVFMCLLVCLSLAAMAEAREVLKVGGVIQAGTTMLGSRAIVEIWADWVNDADLDYMVDVNFTTFEMQSGAADLSTRDWTSLVHNFTNHSLCGSNCSDVFITPGTDSYAIAVIDALPAGTTIPIIIPHACQKWVPLCKSRSINCFSPAPACHKQATQGLEAVYARTTDFTVATILDINLQSSFDDEYWLNEYSAGVWSWVEKHPGVTLVANATVKTSVGTHAFMSSYDDDSEAINDVIAARPDAVIINTLHPYVALKKVVDNNMGYKPKLLQAQNIFTDFVLSDIGNNGRYDLVLYTIQSHPAWPSQDADAVDDITGMSYAVLASLMETRGYGLSWDGNQMWMMVVAILHAMTAGNSGNRKADLVANLRSVDFFSFLGRINFDADGYTTRDYKSLQTLPDGTMAVSPPNENLIYPRPGSEDQVTTISVVPNTTIVPTTDAASLTTIVPTTTIIPSTASNGSEESSETSASIRSESDLPKFVIILLLAVLG